MSLANRLWGVPSIHGDLLKLGIDVVHSTIAKHLAKNGRGGRKLGRLSSTMMWLAWRGSSHCSSCVTPSRAPPQTRCCSGRCTFGGE